MKKKIKKWAKERGYPVAVADKILLNQFRLKIEDMNLPDKINQDLLNSNKEFQLMLENLKELDTVSSVVLVVVPRPAHRLRFQTNQADIEGILPPTYVNYRKLKEQVLSDLVAYLGAADNEFQVFDSFLKTLAVHIGLSTFGRNNITYNEKFGSFFQLVGIGSLEKIETFSTSVSKPRNQLDHCQQCSACLKHCPTKAIRDDRFLIDAHNCISNLNENPGSSIKMSKYAPKYHCIVGCMDCQMICPANKGKLKWEDAPVSFTVKETESLLSGNDVPGGEKWREKIDALGMPYYAEVWGRNLRLIMNRNH